MNDFNVRIIHIRLVLHAWSYICYSLYCACIHIVFSCVRHGQKWLPRIKCDCTQTILIIVMYFMCSYNCERLSATAHIFLCKDLVSFLGHMSNEVIILMLKTSECLLLYYYAELLLQCIFVLIDLLLLLFHIID